MSELAGALRAERLASYARLRGGWPIPLAGGIWWAALAGAGTQLDPYTWSIVAFVTSGAIFPLALLLAKLGRNPFMGDRTVVTGVLLPAFVSMLLFWPIAIAALWTALPLVPLVLAVGMSIHWPVIGWSYCRLAPFIGHALARAVVSFGLWLAFPDDRFVLIPLAVAAIYVVTVLVLAMDSAGVRRGLAATPPAAS